MWVDMVNILKPHGYVLETIKNMIMNIVRCSWFPPKGYAAITLVFWLIAKSNVILTSRLLNHEEIHSRQQKEMMILFFFVWYILEFTIRLCQYRNWNDAYSNISFEREAYANEYNLEYLPTRKHFAWFNYLIKRQ